MPRGLRISAQSITDQAVARDTSQVAYRSVPGALPLAIEWPWHAGLARSTSNAGSLRGSKRVRSSQAWSVAGWFWRWVSTANGQWLIAVTTVAPARVAPSVKPPRPAK